MAPATAAVALSPVARPAPAPARWTRFDAGLMLGLGALALAVRLPNSQLIPAFSDEVVESYRAFLITQGQAMPLTAGAAYNGSLWIWLVAAAFWLSDYSLYAPRALALALGVLTVAAAYPLGRAWGGRAGGILAAALVATASVHIAVNSHVAWGNSATPLFVTLGTWALYEAVRGTTLAPPRALPLAGLSWGLALQTHPSVLALLPGAAVFLLWSGRPLLRRRRAWLAAGLFGAANLNLLAFNLLSDFRSVTAAVEQSVHYTGEEDLAARPYVGRFGLLLLGLLRALAGAVDSRGRPADFLLDPGLWPIALLSAAGVARQWRRGNPLPGLLAVSAILILPTLNGKYEPILNGRYLAPLLPVLYAGVGALVAAGLRRVWGEGAAGGRRSAGARLGQLALGLAAAILVLHPLLYLRAYYEHELGIGRTNWAFFRAVEQVKGVRRPDETITIVRPRREFHMGEGGGLASQAFELALALGKLPYSVADHNSPELLDPSTRCRDRLVIVASRDAGMKREVAARLALRSLDHEPAGGQSPVGEYGLYRLERVPNAPMPC